MPGPQIRPGNSGGGGSGGGSGSSSGGSSSDSGDRDGGGSSTEDRLSSGGGHIPGAPGSPDEGRPDVGGGSGGSGGGGGSVPTDQLGGMPVDAGAEPGDRDGGSSRPSGDQGGGGSVPTDQLGGQPVEAEAGTDPRPGTTDAEIERIRDRTSRANQSVSFGTTGTPSAAGGSRTVDAQQRAEGRRQAAEGVAYSDANLYQEAAQQGFAEGVAASDRRLYEEQAEMESFGDWDWSMGFGGEEDEVENWVDSATEDLASGIEDSANQGADRYREIQDETTVSPYPGVKLGGASVNPEWLESVGRLGGDAARLPSYGMEAAELGSWVLEGARRDDGPQSPFDSDTEYRRRLDLTASAAEEAGGLFVEQAKENPGDFARDSLLGVGVGTAATSATRSARVARAASRVTPDGSIRNRISTEADIIKSGLSDERAQLDLGGPRSSGTRDVIGGEDIDPPAADPDQTSVRPELDPEPDIDAGDPIQRRRERGRGETTTLPDDNPYDTAAPDDYDPGAASNRRVLEGTDDVAEGAEDITGFGESPFDTDMPSVRPGSGAFGGIGGGAFGGVGSLAESREAADQLGLSTQRPRSDSGIGTGTGFGTETGTGTDIGIDTDSGVGTGTGVGTGSGTGSGSGDGSSTGSRPTPGSPTPPTFGSPTPTRPGGRRPPRVPELDLDSGQEDVFGSPDSGSEDDVFASGIQSAEDAFEDFKL